MLQSKSIYFLNLKIMKKIIIWIVLLIILIFLGIWIFVGNEKENKAANTEKDSGSISQTQEEKSISPYSFSPDSLCTAEPQKAENGKDIYPIDPKYGSAVFLGQIFTASDCKSESMNKIFGVEGENYIAGSFLVLKNSPSKELIETLKSITYLCKEDSSDENCKRWELSSNVKIEDLLKLQPFYENFDSDDCIRCGEFIVKENESVKETATEENMPDTKNTEENG